MTLRTKFEKKLRELKATIENRICEQTGLESRDLEHAMIINSFKEEGFLGAYALEQGRFDAKRFVKKYGETFGTTPEEIISGIVQHIKGHDYCQETYSLCEKRDQEQEKANRHFNTVFYKD
jgi:hypothetical protein